MTDEELVEKVARGLCSRVLSDIEIADSAEAVIDNSWRAYVADAETALAIARHIIEREALEKAAKVANCFTSANIDPYQSGDASFDRGYDIGVIDAGKLIAAAIRALGDDNEQDS